MKSLIILAAFLLSILFPQNATFFGQNYNTSSNPTIVLLASCASFTATATCTTSSKTVTSGMSHLIASGSACSGGSGCSSGANNISAITITDSNGGNTWTKPTNGFTNPVPNGSHAIQGSVATSPIAGTYTFTLTATGTQPWGPVLFVYAVTGGTTVDTTVTAHNSGTTGTSQSIVSGTVGQAGELIFAGAANDGVTMTPAQIFLTGSFEDQYTIGPASGTQTMSWSTASASNWSGVVIGIKHP